MSLNKENRTGNSRSVAVIILVKARDKYNFVYILAINKNEYYSLPYGYVNYDETIIQAAARVLKIETELIFPISNYKLISINDNPNETENQDIVFRYIINSNTSIEDLSLLSNKLFRFININDISLYDWKFNHDKLIPYVKKEELN